jgi:voltage-gated potassium channel
MSHKTSPETAHERSQDELIMKRKTIKLLRQSLKITGASKIFGSYTIAFFIIAVLLFLIDPGISTLQDALWYCFAAASTIGFGDVAAASLAGRILTLVLSVFSLIVIAVLTALITNFFMEAARARVNESMQEFLDDLEHLPDLSKEELAALSEKVTVAHGKLGRAFRVRDIGDPVCPVLGAAECVKPHGKFHVFTDGIFPVAADVL